MTERLDSTGKIVTVVSPWGMPRELFLFLRKLLLSRHLLLRSLPAVDRDLFAASQRQLAGRCVLGQRGTRSGGRAFADRHRGHQHVARTDVHVVFDRRAVLVRAIVVA